MAGEVSRETYDKIKRVLFGEEGFRPTAYYVELKDESGNVHREAGLPTIGIGHKIKPGEEHLLTATLTEADAQALAEKDIKELQAPWIKNLDMSKVSENMLIAMTDAAFNMGGHAALFPKMVDLINAGKKDEAAELLGRWGKTVSVTKSDGTVEKVVSPALEARVSRRVEAFKADDSVDVSSILGQHGKKKLK